MQNRVRASFLLLFLLCSCAGAGTDRSIPELARTVPSDAVCVAFADRADNVLALIPDTTDVLLSLDLGEFKDNRAVLSCCYTGKLNSMLAIDAGRSRPDTSKAVLSIIEASRDAGLNALYLPVYDTDGHRAAILLSRSESMLHSASIHLEPCASISDAPGFSEAFCSAPDTPLLVLIRAEGMERVLPQGLFGRNIARRTAARFLHSAADWYMIDAGRAPVDYALTYKCSDFDSQFGNMLSALDPEDSKLAQILPRSVDFVLNIQTGSNFRTLYEQWMDANNSKSLHSTQLALPKRSAGFDPLDWESDLRIREVALVRWNNREVLLARRSRNSKDEGISVNEMSGFIPALYGKIFSIANDQYCANIGQWSVFGSEPDVEAFLAIKENFDDKRWPQKDCRFAIYYNGSLYCWDKKGLRIENIR